MHLDEFHLISDIETGGPPEFVDVLRSCSTKVGDQVVLECRVKGSPTPKIRWLKNGKEVYTSFVNKLASGIYVNLKNLILN
jgi:hypothetical protein